MKAGTVATDGHVRETSVYVFISMYSQNIFPNAQLDVTGNFSHVYACMHKHNSHITSIPNCMQNKEHKPSSFREVLRHQARGMITSVALAWSRARSLTSSASISSLACMRFDDAYFQYRFVSATASRDTPKAKTDHNQLFQPSC
jgi:hypothetical protein